jgi:hypothetical protein
MLFSRRCHNPSAFCNKMKERQDFSTALSGSGKLKFNGSGGVSPVII